MGLALARRRCHRGLLSVAILAAVYGILVQVVLLLCAVMSVAALIFECHGRALRAMCDASRANFQGLRQGERVLRAHLSAHRRLIQTDAAFALIRHVSGAGVELFMQELQRELDDIIMHRQAFERMAMASPHRRSQWDGRKASRHRQSVGLVPPTSSRGPTVAIRVWPKRLPAMAGQVAMGARHVICAPARARACSGSRSR